MLWHDISRRFIIIVINSAFFLVLAHLGSPGQRAVKRVCVCVCNSAFYCQFIHTENHECVLFIAFRTMLFGCTQPYALSGMGEAGLCNRT